MSLLNVDTVEPEGATTDLTLGAGGDKVVIPGTIKISGGSPGADKILTSDADGDATWEASAAGGKILQVVSFPYSTAETSTSATLSDTSLTVDITPASTSNKVLILLSVPVRSDRNASYTGTVLAAAKFAITRGGSEIYVNQLHSSGANFTSATSYIETNLSVAYLDSPSATLY